MVPLYIESSTRIFFFILSFRFFFFFFTNLKPICLNFTETRVQQATFLELLLNKQEMPCIIRYTLMLSVELTELYILYSESVGKRVITIGSNCICVAQTIMNICGLKHNLHASFYLLWKDGERGF